MIVNQTTVPRCNDASFPFGISDLVGIVSPPGSYYSAKSIQATGTSSTMPVIHSGKFNPHRETGIATAIYSNALMIYLLSVSPRTVEFWSDCGALEALECKAFHKAAFFKA